jgi:adhesin transport system membrane fusion protein
LIKNGEELSIIPGMVASVDVLTGRRTVLQYLTKPFHRMRFNAMRER